MDPGEAARALMGRYPMFHSVVQLYDAATKTGPQNLREEYQEMITKKNTNTDEKKVDSGESLEKSIEVSSVTVTSVRGSQRIRKRRRPMMTVKQIQTQ